MSYRFTLAAVAAAITLTGCAKQQTSSEQPENYFQGPSQINVSHVVTRADDGSDIFLTIDGNNAGPLIAGQTNQVSVPAGKHQVGGYASTILGLGRVTIQPLEITTKPGEQTQIAYSVTKTKPVFVNEGVSKLPAKPAPEPVKQEATPEPAQTTSTLEAPPVDITSPAATALSGAVTTSQPTSSDSSGETSGMEAVQRATGASATTSGGTVTTSQPATTDSSTATSSTQAAQPTSTTTETSQSTAQPATTTETTKSTTQPTTTTETTQSPVQPTTTETTQSTTDNVDAQASTAE